MMDHPNIAKVYDAGATDEGRPFFVMEYIPGVPLNNYCEEHKLALRGHPGRKNFSPTKLPCFV
jgi:serine/threonine protein kinase